MHFTVEAHRIASQYISRGDIVIDATAGNGFDTLFLAQTVGEVGCVYAIDIQPSAIEIVQRKTIDAGVANQVRIVQQSHSKLLQIVDASHAGCVSAILFNLGYLPFGDKSLVTTPETTLPALDASLQLLKSGGLLSVLVYAGHLGGETEATAVQNWIESKSNVTSAVPLRDESNSRSPTLWKIIKA